MANPSDQSQTRSKDRLHSFRVGALVAWAAQLWPERFSDLPRDPNLVEVEVSESAQAGDSVEAIVFPATMENCHRLIAEMAQSEKVLKQLARYLMAERDALEPDALAWRALCQRSAAAARKPRGGEKSG